MATYKNRPERQ